MLLYDLDVSGNCYKIRLFAALTGTKLDLVPVNLASGENHDPNFRKLNPFGEVPVLVDDDLTLRDSQAILVYLAGRLRDRTWWPEDALSQATITQWLSVASSEVRNGPNAARLIRKFGYPLDMNTAMRWTDKLLPLLNAHVGTQDWFALNRPTIADCALFPYLTLAPEGGIDLAPYPFLGRWLDRVRNLPGFISMPGL
ncbi:glutathione S-transferase family protein [Acidomonas methanolica]|uniref:Glutathione S-transferase n=1 Tax=Acidomonas methanolica NBRC 104435 TaxID=1231351 RepID=A0A023D4X0_ACIMT|nr:glutathione S-transferase [Acidomonas methanolica]MBU2653093.1 glutathione S-transferase [Acidomonas methanolica]TCS27210.1 glutathione S-transferase [Acidomonas methanolica]GAJ29119.1 glutathione S-transferase [Acidomonas methanolica NBRC 104435]GBQ47022.1 glutathione S-transferase [Acidomonas methanolica]GEK99955.1 glutathione S-transferase [Acidomonas methanolica NBRC 104435]